MRPLMLPPGAAYRTDDNTPGGDAGGPGDCELHAPAAAPMTPAPRPADPVAPALPPPAHAGLAYPPARTGDASDTHHGVAIADPYRWLEDYAFFAAQLGLTLAP